MLCCRTTFQNVSVVATTIIREVHPHELMKIVKPFKLATLLKFEQKREHFTKHGMHLNARGKALAAKLIVNWVNSIQKMEKESVADGKLSLMTVFLK